MTVATRLRILIKSADFLERASDVDTLILDKTGTVTVGAPAVTEIRPAEGESEEALLAVAAACGFGSLHPGLARRRGRSSGARNRRARLRRISGAAGPWRGRDSRRPAGRPRAPRAPRRARHRRRTRKTARTSRRYGSRYGGRCLGRFVLRDQPRAEAREALAAMRALGIDRLVLLTGDRAAAAREVGDALGMDEVVAEVLPAQKLRWCGPSRPRGARS